MNAILESNPILLLFIVASLGYLIGSIKIRGGSLGVAAVLFTGLAFGALNPAYTIPDIIFLLGLSIFVYSIGLRSGPAFFNSYKKNGVRDFIFIISMLVLTGLIATAIFFICDLSAANIAGMYAGSSTNTAAMAGVIESLSTSNLSGAGDLISDVALGYTYSYPMGVMAAIIMIIVMEKVFKIDYDAEKKALASDYPIGTDLTSRTLEITKDSALGASLRDLQKKHKWNVNFGRYLPLNGKPALSHWDLHFRKGDQIMVVGSNDEIEAVESVLGQIIKSPLAYDRQDFDVRRIFVSNAHLAGRTLASLNLSEKFSAVITRIRRGDTDLLARPNMVLELGDRIRFIASRKDLKALSSYFGDSYYQSSKVNLFSFGLGIGLGLLIGAIPIPLGGEFSFKFGFAGGPLIVGLLLGTLRRTGPIVWTLPYGANVTLEQIGLIFLLSAVGVKSGNAFVESITSSGLEIFIGGAVVSLATAFFTLLVGYKLLKIPFSFLMGMVSNQPAILDFARNRAKSRVVDYGFTMVFPIALIMKIIIAQVLFLVLSSL